MGAEERTYAVTVTFDDDGTFDLGVAHIPQDKHPLLSRVLREAGDILAHEPGDEWKDPFLVEEVEEVEGGNTEEGLAGATGFYTREHTYLCSACHSPAYWKRCDCGGHWQKKTDCSDCCGDGGWLYCKKCGMEEP